MRVSLRAGEKLYLNGAVICADRKVSLELLNDVTFLLESHVLQASQATSPLRQLYFAVQLILMEPSQAPTTRVTAIKMFSAFETAMNGYEIAGLVQNVRALFEGGRLIETLKALRSLFPIEEQLAAPSQGRAEINQRKEHRRCRSQA